MRIKSVNIFRAICVCVACVYTHIHMYIHISYKAHLKYVFKYLGGILKMRAYLKKIVFKTKGFKIKKVVRT